MLGWPRKVPGGVIAWTPGGNSTQAMTHIIYAVLLLSWWPPLGYSRRLQPARDLGKTASAASGPLFRAISTLRPHQPQRLACSSRSTCAPGHSTTVHGWFDSYADKTGFYIIAPDAGKQCFDSSAPAALATRQPSCQDGELSHSPRKNADKTQSVRCGNVFGRVHDQYAARHLPGRFRGVVRRYLVFLPARGLPAISSCTKCGSTPPSDRRRLLGKHGA